VNLKKEDAVRFVQGIPFVRASQTVLATSCDSMFTCKKRVYDVEDDMIGIIWQALPFVQSAPLKDIS
jgi:hypothetical protein